MIKLAIVEDDDNDARRLSECLERYEKEIGGGQFNYVRFRNGTSFLSSDKQFDIVFMDIMLPDITGMEVANELRKHNDSVTIIFVTNMIKFAIESYKVDALDYVLKPVSYERVTLKLAKAVRNVQASKGITLLIKNLDEITRIPSSEVYYIEVRGHKRLYHCKGGELFDHGSLSDVENVLKKYDFVRASSCYLINLDYIKSVNGLEINMANGEVLHMSHTKKQYFMGEFTKWLGRN